MNLWQLDLLSNTLPTELATLMQEWSSTLNIYCRNDIEPHKLESYMLAVNQVGAPPKATLYQFYTFTLTQYNLDLEILSLVYQTQ